MERKRIESLIKSLTVIAFILLFACGAIYYIDTEYNLLYKLSFIINNAISSFAFKPDVDLVKMLGFLNTHKNYPQIIGYLYAFALNIAPLCTVAFFYKVFRKLYNYSSWLTQLFSKNKERVFIIGFNDIVKEWCKENYNNNCKRNLIIIIDDNIPDNDLNFLIETKTLFKKKNIDNKKYNYIEYLKTQRLTINDRIIIFENSNEYNSSIENLSTYLKLEECNVLCDDIAIDIYCDDNNVHNLIEEANDSTYINNKFKYNIEVFDYRELIVRKVLMENPLYNYYGKTKISLDDTTIHLMIIGFGDYGRSFLIQAMNLAVLGSKNKIIIDIIDKNIKLTKTKIDNMFSNSYVKQKDCTNIDVYEYYIDDKDADGELTIRLHKVDCKSEEFKKIFKKINNSNQLINNIVISLPTPDIIYNTLRFIQEEMVTDDKTSLLKGKINIYLKDSGSTYFSKTNRHYESELFDHINIIEFNDNGSSIDDIINNNLVYSHKNEIFDAESLIVVQNHDGTKKGKRKKWNDNDIYGKESTLARAANISYILWSIKKYAECNWDISEDKILKKSKNEIENLNIFNIADDNQTFTCKYDINKTLNIIENNYFIKEFIIAEHRRWCYYLASKGWGQSNIEKYLEYSKYEIQKYYDLKEKYHKRKFIKKHVCMCNWETLKTKLSKYCIYDLKPLIYISYGYIKDSRV